MSAPFFPSPLLSAEEWDELTALRKAISDSPAAVVPEKQERFSALFARSLLGKGNQPLNSLPFH
jgi:hypothetical protein